MLNKFPDIIDRISSFFGYSVAILIPAMVIVIDFELISRYVFEKPTLWAYDISIYCYGYCGLIAGAHVLKKKEHINVEIIFERLNEKTKAIVNSIMSILMIYFLVLLILYSYKAALASIIMGERSDTMWAPKIGHYRMLITASGVLMLLQGIANWSRDIRKAFKDREKIQCR